MNKLDITKCVVVVSLIILLALFAVGSFGNLQYVKDNAESRFAENGFVVVGYEGYQWGGFQGLFTNYGGAKVWYNIESNRDDGILYNCYLKRWGNEIHIYKLVAVNAIQP